MPDADAGRAGGRTSVVIVPHLRSNPYQELLAVALNQRGVRARLEEGRGARLSIVRAWLRAGAPRVLHLHWTHHFLERGGGLGALEARTFLAQLDVLRALGVRVVWTLHNLEGHESDDGSGGVDAATRYRRHRALVQRCHTVIAHCSAAVHLASAAYGLGPAERSRFRVIPHGSYEGVYPDWLDRGPAKERLKLGADTTVFLALGAIRDYKGLDALVRAFRGLDAPAARLVIAGKPRGKPIVEQLQRLAGGDPRIRLRFGRVPDEEIATHLRAADVAVLPYARILTSGSAALAMGFGVPVIAPRLGCLPTMVPDEAGLLYDPDAGRAGIHAPPGADGRPCRDGRPRRGGDGTPALAHDRDPHHRRLPAQPVADGGPGSRPGTVTVAPGADQSRADAESTAADGAGAEASVGPAAGRRVRLGRAGAGVMAPAGVPAWSTSSTVGASAARSARSAAVVAAPAATRLASSSASASSASTRAWALSRFARARSSDAITRSSRLQSPLVLRPTPSDAACPFDFRPMRAPPCRCPSSDPSPTARGQCDRHTPLTDR